MLLQDPDYEDTNYRSREKVVFDEANKRAKQHERNNQALSLGSSESVNKLLKFLLKADEDGEDENSPFRRLPEGISVAEYEAQRKGKAPDIPLSDWETKREDDEYLEYEKGEE